MLSVRPARADDLGRLLAILEATAARSDVRTGAALLHHPHDGWSEPERVLRAMSDAAQFVIVGLIDDYVAGFVLGGTAPLLDGGSLVTVRALRVELPFREVGVGEALLAEAVRWSGERGHEAIDVDVVPGDRLMKALLERGGFKARKITMHRDLDRTTG